jgi:hypothetical protein
LLYGSCLIYEKTEFLCLIKKKEINEPKLMLRKYVCLFSSLKEWREEIRCTNWGGKRKKKKTKKKGSSQPCWRTVAATLHLGRSSCQNEFNDTKKSCYQSSEKATCASPKQRASLHGEGCVSRVKQFFYFIHDSLIIL